MSASDRLPARLQAPFRQLSSLYSTSLWVLPTIAAVIAVVVAIVALRVPGDAVGIDLPFGEPDDARTALSTVLSATVAATSLVFTGTVVAIQLATGQYSPRLLRNVLLDPRIRVSLAVFVGTVVYTLTVIPQITTRDDPQVAVSIGLVLGMGVVGALVAFLDRIVSRLRLETIIGDVRDKTLSALETAHPQNAEHDHVALDEEAQSVPALRSGYVQSVSMDALSAAVRRFGCTVQMRPRIGDFLVASTPAAYAWRVDGDALDEDELDELTQAVDGALALGVDRTLDGDPAYGLRHLVDVGLRGVSPGINDPTTAAQTIHLATEVLVELSRRVCDDTVERHGDDAAIVRRPDLGAYLELAQSQLVQYGGHDARVVEALAHQLRDVVTGGTVPERIDAVERQLRLLREDVDDRDHGENARQIIDEACDAVDDLLAGVPATDEQEAAG